MYLIVGGSGALGGAIVRRLLAAGESVRVMTRTPAQVTALADAEIVHGDLLDRDSVARACQGASTIVAAAHAIFGRGETASVHVDGRGHRDLIDAAKSAGASRFVYTSIYDAGPEFHAVPFVRIKYETEQYLKSSGLDYTILRPTAFMESHAHFLIGEPILRKGKTVLFGQGELPRNFVAADDVAQVAMRAFSDPALSAQTIDVGGPGNHSNMDVVRLYEQASGRKAKVTHVPLGVLKVASCVLRPLHPGLSQIMQLSILADRTDQSFDAGPLQQRFSLALTRLEDWVTAKVARSRL